MVQTDLCNLDFSAKWPPSGPEWSPHLSSIIRCFINRNQINKYIKTKGRLWCKIVMNCSKNTSLRATIAPSNQVCPNKNVYANAVVFVCRRACPAVFLSIIRVKVRVMVISGVAIFRCSHLQRVANTSRPLHPKQGLRSSRKRLSWSSTIAYVFLVKENRNVLPVLCIYIAVSDMITQHCTTSFKAKTNIVDFKKW